MGNTKMTNTMGISLPLAVWALVDDYDHSTDDSVISVTSLMKPTRQIIYGRRYKDSLKEMDAKDLIASSMGTALHDSVENAWKQKDKVVQVLENLGYSNCADIFDKITFEKRTVLPVGDYNISGKFDLVFSGIVADIKSTSVWSYIYGSKDADYILQMSIYKWLNPTLITNDYGYIEYIFTDWSGEKARADRQYPQQRVLSHKLKLLSLDETDKWLKKKIAVVAKYEALKDSELPECTDEELWSTADKWKYYKKEGAARATKVFDNELDANTRLAKEGTGVVKLFKGGVKRCGYCNYINLCDQYTKLQLEGRV